MGKHTKALANVFRIAENWGEDEEARVRSILNDQSTVIPQVSSQAKDHKPVQESGVPKARGDNEASRTINQRLSDLTNDNIMALLKADGGEEM